MATYQEALNLYNKYGVGIRYEDGTPTKPIVIGRNEYGDIILNASPGVPGNTAGAPANITIMTPGPDHVFTFQKVDATGGSQSWQKQMAPDKNRALQSLFKAAAVAAPMFVGPALAGAGLISAPAAAGAAGAAEAAGALGAAGAAETGIGAGLFAGGVEQAALGASPGLLGGGAAASAPLTMAGVGATNFAAPALGGGAQMASSGLMDWLGKPAAQAAGQLVSAGLQGYAANRASQQQAEASQAGIEEQRRQFEATRQALAPFAQAGTQALGGFAPYQAAGLQAFGQQQALAGLQGQQAQLAAIGALEASPEYQALARQGEEAILQRASATGGLRGGNVQAALAQFRPAMLQQLIDQQYQRLGGFAGTGLQTTGALASMGQSAAAQQGQFGAGAAANIGNLLAQQGQAQAGGTLGTSRAISQALNIPATLQQYQAGRDLFRT